MPLDSGRGDSRGPSCPVHVWTANFHSEPMEALQVPDRGKAGGRKKDPRLLVESLCVTWTPKGGMLPASWPEVASAVAVGIAPAGPASSHSSPSNLLTAGLCRVRTPATAFKT